MLAAKQAYIRSQSLGDELSKSHLNTLNLMITNR